MARVKGVGELDWAVFAPTDDIQTVSAQPQTIFRRDSKQRLVWTFLLRVDENVEENSLSHAIESRFTICYAFEKIHPDQQNASVAPVVLRYICFRLSKEPDVQKAKICGPFTMFGSSAVSLSILTEPDQIIWYPDRFLQSLARKMSKWAKEC